jgi:hypothetical protein
MITREVLCTSSPFDASIPSVRHITFNLYSIYATSSPPYCTLSPLKLHAATALLYASLSCVALSTFSALTALQLRLVVVLKITSLCSLSPVTVLGIGGPPLQPASAGTFS